MDVNDAYPCNTIHVKYIHDKCCWPFESELLVQSVITNRHEDEYILVTLSPIIVMLYHIICWIGWLDI